MKRTLLLLSILLAATALRAQPWLDAINTPNPDLRNAWSVFNDYWNGRPDEKGRGIKAFKRWAWFWESRLLPDGSLPDRSIAWKEWAKYEARVQSKSSFTQAGSWVFRGPATTGSGYYGIGRLNCVTFHPTDANTFYVGSAAGGLWKTTNGGATWMPLTDDLPVMGVSDVAIDPSNPSTVYLVTGDGDGTNTYSIGVLKSTDGGITWNTTGMSWTVTSFKLLKRIQINPLNPQMLWVAASDGIWRSLNGGTTWTNVQSGSFSDIELKPGDPNTVYAASYAANSVIYRSTDAGATFSAMTTINGGRRLNLAVTAANPQIVQVLACNSSGGLHGLWKSSDAGQTFTQYLTGTITNNMLNSSATGAGSGGQGTYDLAFTISPTDSNAVWLGGVNTWSSADGGNNWLLKTAWSGGLSGAGGVPVVHADKHFQVFHPLQPNTLFECNDGGIYKTDNSGATWTDLSAGLGISQLYRIGVSVTNTNHVLAGLQDNSTKEYKNNAWVDKRATGDGFESIIDPINGNVLYVSSYYGNISKTVNSGNTWVSIVQASGAGVHGQGAWLTPYVLNPLSNTTLLLAKSQVYRSYDGGTNWTQLTSFTTTTNAAALAYAPSDTNVMYAAYGSRLWRSLDGGTTWTNPLSGTANISYIAVHPTNPQRIWITFSGYTAGSKVQTSADGGTTWTNINGSLPNLPVNCIVYQVGSNDGLYIGTDVGVYYRNATMSDWEAFKDGLPNVIVNELEISYNNNKLWAATYGRGLWNSDLFGTVPCTPPAAPTSNGNTAICQGDPAVTLSVTAPSGQAVDWYATPTGGLPLVSSSATYATNLGGTYYAGSRNPANDCVSATRTAVTLTVNPAPGAPSITVGGNTTFCSSNPLTLTSSATSGNQWYLNGVAITGATGQTYAANQSGMVTVRVTVNGCSSSNSTPAFLTANPAPAQPTISVNGNLLTSSSATGNQWYLNGVAITGATGQTYSATNPGIYTVQVSTAGCTSAASSGYNHVGTAIVSPTLEQQVRMAPNPVHHQLVITYTGNTANFDLEVLDMKGRRLQTGRFSNRYTVNMERMAAGAYLVRVTNRRTGESTQQQIVKE